MRFLCLVHCLVLQLGLAGATASAASPEADLLANFRVEDWVRIPLGKDKQLSARNPWQCDAATGILRCEGVGIHEMLLHRMPRGDGILRVEWRYPGAPAKANSGIYVRSSRDGATWLQAQLSLAAPGTLFGIDSRQPATPIKISAGSRRPDLLHGEGEWNVMEITCRGTNVSLRFNGVDVAEATGLPPEGHAGLEAEFAVIEFRAMSFRPLP